MDTENNLDIVKLIEKNPITRLSKDYESKLITKIKENFTESQQQLFVASFYCYLNYNSKNDFVIDLDNIWRWTGFSRKDHAKTLLNKHFIENIDYNIVFLQPRENSKGGRPIEQILLTINTFKKFCLKAGTKKADEIHDYYIKLEELIQETLNQESDELKNQLNEKNNEIIVQKTNHQLNLKMNKHKVLIEQLKTKKCVYVGEIKENELIKIGSSGDIYGREFGLNRTFGNLLFLEIFECDNFREIEQKILNDPIIKQHLYKKPINEHISKEVVELSKNFSYEQVLYLVKKYIASTTVFTPEQLIERQKLDIEQQKLDIEKQKLNMEKQKLDFDTLSFLIKEKQSSNIIEQYFNTTLQTIFENTKSDIPQNNKQNNEQNDKQMENKIKSINIDDTLQTSAHDSSRGRKIQKIDPIDTTKIIKVYESMTKCVRDLENDGFHKSCIQNAIKNNSLYKNFRWNFVEFGDDPNISKVEPTKKTITQNRSPILKLDPTKTEILASYATLKNISDEINVTRETIRNYITQNKQLNGFYYINLNDCDKELLEKYNSPINKFISNKSRTIKCINIKTKEETVFNSLIEIHNKCGIAEKTIRKLIESGESYKGFTWHDI